MTARYLDAVTFEQKEVTQTITIGDLLAEADPQLLKGAAIFAYAEGLKQLRDEDDNAGIAEAQAAVARAEEALPGDPDLAEMSAVLAAL